MDIKLEVAINNLLEAMEITQAELHVPNEIKNLLKVMKEVA